MATTGFTALLLLLPALLVSSLTDSEQLADSAVLAADDECIASSGDEGHCGVHALQFRALAQDGDGAVEDAEDIQVKGSAAVTDPAKNAVPPGSCAGQSWCKVLTGFSELFDTNVPSKMQQAVDTYGEFQSDAEGLTLALTTRNYYVMYHKNVERVLNTYMPQGYFAWGFQKNLTEVSPRENDGRTAHVVREGTLTLDLGWKKTIFWNAVVRTLPHEKTFPWTTAQWYSDCKNSPAKMLYTLQLGHGGAEDWTISELTIIKL